MGHNENRKTPQQHDLAAEPIDVNDPAVLRVHVVADGDGAGGWVHTHGLAAFGLPELEIRGIQPPYLAPVAGHILTEIADYLLNGSAEVCLGDTMDLGLGSCVRFERSEPLASQPDHYERERWSVVDMPPPTCGLCEALEQSELGPTGPGGPRDPLPN